MQMTDRIYYRDTILSTCQAEILRRDRDATGSFLVFDRTIFHPQEICLGGGQPLDEGHVILEGERVPVLDVKLDDEVLKHYVPSQISEGFASHVEVTQEIDIQKRLQYAKLHSMGHLISAVVNEEFPALTASKGHHFPNQASVVFQGSPMPDKEHLKTRLLQRVTEALKKDIKVTVEQEGEGRVRTMTIDGYDGTPCGGTHVSSFGEIKELIIRSVKKQKNELKIGYDVS